MNILAIDTATETLGICFQNKKKQVVSVALKMGFQHSVFLVPWVERILEQAGTAPSQLNLVVCSLGPGSFTGLRIGLATAKGLALGADCPLAGVCSLDAIAYGFKYHRGVVVPVIDARKSRFYAALYRDGERITENLDLTKESLLDNCRMYGEVLLTGPGARDIFHSAGEHERDGMFKLDPGYALVNPYYLLKAGVEKYLQNKEGEPDSASPLYLRKSEAEMKQEG